VADLSESLRAAVEPSLEAGEELVGVCVATQQSTFKGRAVALATTDRRIIVQGLNRKFAPDGQPLSITPETLAGASADGAGGGWINVGAAIMDGTAVTLKLRTTDGEKLKLMMMRGGAGLLGGLGGGEGQQQGVQAVAEWFSRNVQ
jgi:hypothetical protein